MENKLATKSQDSEAMGKFLHHINQANKYIKSRRTYCYRPYWEDGKIDKLVSLIKHRLFCKKLPKHSVGVRIA